MSGSEVYEKSSELPGERVIWALEQIAKDRSITPAGRGLARKALEDARALAVQEGIWENVRLGRFEIAGTDDQGQLRYRITPAGEAHVRGMVARSAGDVQQERGYSPDTYREGSDVR